MTGFDDRRKGFEAKWVHDEDLRFRVEARRNRMLGMWAAGEKGLTGEAAEELTVSVIAADFQEKGDEDVFRKLRAELDAGKYPDALIREKMAKFLSDAVQAVTAGS